MFPPNTPVSTPGIFVLFTGCLYFEKENIFVKKLNICNLLFLRFLYHNKTCSFLMNLQFLNKTSKYKTGGEQTLLIKLCLDFSKREDYL